MALPRNDQALEPAAYPAPYLRAIGLYRSGHHWHAHEALEDLWRRTERDPLKCFYQGVIQLAAAFVHADRENMRGVCKLIKKSARNLRRCPSPFMGIDTAELICQMMRCLEEASSVESGRKRCFDWALKPGLALSSPEILGGSIGAAGASREQSSAL